MCRRNLGRNEMRDRVTNGFLGKRRARNGEAERGGTRARFAKLALVAFALAFSACGKSTSSEDGQSHWLAACDTSAACGSALSFGCGHCVEPCASGTSCSIPDGRAASCVDAAGEAARALCGAPSSTALCLATCDAGCTSGEVCVGAACIPKGVTSGVGGAGSGGQGGAAGGRKGGDGRGRRGGR